MCSSKITLINIARILFAVEPKSEISKHPSCLYSPTVKYENLDHKNLRFRKHPTEHPALFIFKYENLNL